MFLHMFQPLNFDVSKLTQSGGIRTIPALIRCHGSGMSIKAHKTIQRELIPLLPQLKASDANLLTIADRRCLNIWLNNELYGHLLKFKPDIDFVLAILKAYEQVGDAKALPFVERLASRRPLNERQHRLRDAALNCLPLMQANTSAVDHTQTLLRAADKATAAPDTLLRSAAHAQPAVPDELLRADPSATETPLP